MPIALIAKITINQRHLLQSQWAHDIVHAFVAARQNALARLEETPVPPSRP